MHRHRLLRLVVMVCIGALMACGDSLTAPMPLATISLSVSQLTLPVGQTARIGVTATDAAGDRVTDPPLTWTSSNSGIASVVSDGTVRGIAPGDAFVIASAGGKADSAMVRVSAGLAGVTVTPSPAVVTVGGTVQLTATVKDDAGRIIAGQPVTWTTDAPSVATVSSAGLVSGLATGLATITATSGGRSGSTQVQVGTVPVAAVAVSPNPAAVQIGATVQLTATVTDASGKTLVGRTVSWSSSNAAVATVSASGVATGVAAGTATISATSEGKSGTTALSVTVVPVATVSVTPAAAMFARNGTVSLTATLRDGSGNVLTNRSVTWTSSNTAIATVASTGARTATVTGAGVGQATITATSDDGKSGTATLTVTYAAGTYLDRGYCSANPWRRLDLYVPSASKPRPAPVAVFIHGGAWASGDKSDGGWRFTSTKTELLNRGYIVANLNYRLMNDTTPASNMWPAQINDVKCAVRWLRGKADSLGADQRRFAAWGTSAGSHLAAMLGVTTSSAGFDAPELGFSDESSEVQAVADLSGPVDLTQPDELLFDYAQVFTTTDPASSVMINASPVHYAGAASPPFLIIHGDHDDVVLLAQSERLYARLWMSGASVDSIMVKNADHSLSPVPGTSISPTQTQIVQRIANFFDASLPSGAAPSALLAAWQR
jgi:uncharacterized protein YjdB